MKKITKFAKLMCCVAASQSLLTACNPANVKDFEASNDKRQIEEMLQTVGISVDSVQDAIFKAENALQSGKTDLAQLYYIKAYEREPNNVQVLQKMADLYERLKKYDLAEVSLKLLLVQQPGDLKTMEQYGLLLIKLGNYQAAEEKLGQVVAMRQSWPAYNGLGIIANLQGNAAKAEGLFKKADSLSPNSPELLNNIGFALYSGGKLDEAASYYAKALQINPDFKKAIYNYGLLQARLNHYQEARNAFAKVSSSAEADNNIGYIAMMNGDYAEASNYLQEAIREAPRFYKKANDNLARLEQLGKQ